MSAEAPLTPQEIAAHFGLEPLPEEGGLVRRLYLSPDRVAAAALPPRYPPLDKPFGSAIVYLLTDDPDSFSALHRLPTDEVYHFYLGDPVDMLLLFPDGSSRHVVLGQDLRAGQVVQFVAPRGVWQGSRLLPGGRFALLGTTMAPAYSNDDYEGGERRALLERYPGEAQAILRLTRQSP